MQNSLAPAYHSSLAGLWSRRLSARLVACIHYSLPGLWPRTFRPACRPLAKERGLFNVGPLPSVRCSVPVPAPRMGGAGTGPVLARCGSLNAPGLSCMPFSRCSAGRSLLTPPFLLSVRPSPVGNPFRGLAPADADMVAQGTSPCQAFFEIF